MDEKDRRIPTYHSRWLMMSRFSHKHSSWKRHAGDLSYFMVIPFHRRCGWFLIKARLRSLGFQGHLVDSLSLLKILRGYHIAGTILYIPLSGIHHSVSYSLRLIFIIWPSPAAQTPSITQTISIPNGGSITRVDLHRLEVLPVRS